MLIKEAKWIGEQIDHLNLVQDSVVLNFGSQLLYYNKENKHISEFVINPIKQKCQLKNLDLQVGPGIDFSGDILNDLFFTQLLSTKFDCVLLNNVLEHVTEMETISYRIGQLIKPGGYLIFSGPNRYPLHYDPIDNGFRPNIEEVLSLFKEFKLIKGEIVTDYTYSFYVMKSVKKFIRTFVRVLMPFHKFDKWKKVVLPKFKWWNQHYKITCTVLQKL